jgi:2,3-bisphosphoglycerate-dependent phosphoglycerate mutase
VQEILPGVLNGKRTLVAAHGNSLRALIMALEGISGQEIINLELGTGVPIVYRLNADSTVASKEVLAA